MCGIFLLAGDTRMAPAMAGSIAHRGPDETRAITVDADVTIVFHRLAIRGEKHGAAMQPFHDDQFLLMANAEVYNVPQLFARDPSVLRMCQSHSDCEPVFHGIRKRFHAIAEEAPDADFFSAFVSYTKGLISEHAIVVVDKRFANCEDASKRFWRIFVSRDLLGVRPLFVGVDSTPFRFGLCSEAKGLAIMEDVRPFPPGHCALFSVPHHTNPLGAAAFSQTFTPFMTVKTLAAEAAQETTQASLRETIARAVYDRLISDVEVGFFLSGGLDSSLVAGLAVDYIHYADKSGAKPKTFSIGLKGSERSKTSDLAYARAVAERLGTDHHEVLFTVDEAIAAVPEVIKSLETYDITTVRASVPMYLLAKYISRSTAVRVLLSGECADEVFAGYLYFGKAPSADALQDESKRLMSELFMYDILRADRTTAAWGLELRVPFADPAVVKAGLNIPPAQKMHKPQGEKRFMREAFADEDTIPSQVLFRRKEAFSDGVGHDWRRGVMAHAEEVVSDADLESSSIEFPFTSPMSKEALWYRRVFEGFYPGKANLVAGFWMPRWVDEKIDPSATVLSVYQS